MSKQIDKLAWLYIEQGKLLTARSKGKELFYIPGGKREVGESDHQALIREVKEELSVDLVPETIRYVETFSAQADGKNKGTIVKLTCYVADYSGELSPDNEIEQLEFLSYQQLRSGSKATAAVMEWLKIQGLID
ncbi:NUDIX hydrolase [Psychromonas ossibalaenae]|uniref:NUDIX hydrolase n=1 Tax=Psychromonas ossibalaenae TaxID=444922 RepID=UPI00037C8213|nr:NUDIX domain-containing protein [Psychromonas ossibalaenae]